ncbi:MAG TPA: hypothetical protein VIM12_18425 [Noviherbaspirillum sp.]|jgi:hypothetical protein|uniref:hypothetical protein n=1 Tax=Noviherbaspirillum sp. TaxID=1926288 RepID=UPI002F942F2F
MQVSELEDLDRRLHALQDRMRQYSMREDAPLDDRHPLVQEATTCDFMLPEVLTVGNLAETVARKIGNVRLLLERARKHEGLPESAQLAAGQEYMMDADDYRVAHDGAGAQERRPAG